MVSIAGISTVTCLSLCVSVSVAAARRGLILTKNRSAKLKETTRFKFFIGFMLVKYLLPMCSNLWTFVQSVVHGHRSWHLHM
jgi:hypothetical protein